MFSIKKLLKISRLLHNQSYSTSCRHIQSASAVSQKTTAQNQWQDHDNLVEHRCNVDLLKPKNVAEEECPYIVLQHMGVTTEGRVHSFNFASDKVIKFIKMGMINKNLAAQYCHYISELAATLTDSENSNYYSKQSLDLLLYLLRNNKSLTNESLMRLMGDVSNTSRENCLAVCKYLLEKPDMVVNFSSKFFSKIMHACYMYEEWQMATNILCKNSDTTRVSSIWLIDPLVKGLMSSAERYQSSKLTRKEKNLLRSQVIEHLLKFLEESFKSRIQFITKNKDEFIAALEKIKIKVHKSPIIKMSGRCTACNSNLPLFDDNSVIESNSKIKDILHTSVRNRKEIFVNAKYQDLEAFDKFLEESYKIDNRHFDLVIDGLNVAFRNSVGTYYIKQALTDQVTRSIKRHDTRAQTQVLINCIIRGHMLDKFKKILVIGRQHMRNWPGLLDFFAKEGIYHYFPDNVSKDDLHQLYAATLSPRTLFVTCDLFRDHLSLMNNRDRLMLERWVDTHQCWVCTKNLKTIYPTPYQKLGSVQRDKGCFHVPVIDFHKLEIMSDHEPPPHLNHKMLTWLCCRIDTILLHDE